jgi:hypothetical protein
MSFFKKILKSKDLNPCPFCKSELKVINLKDKNYKSEIPEFITNANKKEELDLLVFCSNDQCGMNVFFDSVVINTYEEQEKFINFWNNRK